MRRELQGREGGRETEADGQRRVFDVAVSSLLSSSPFPHFWRRLFDSKLLISLGSKFALISRDPSRDPSDALCFAPLLAPISQTSSLSPLSFLFQPPPPSPSLNQNLTPPPQTWKLPVRPPPPSPTALVSPSSLSLTFPNPPFPSPSFLFPPLLCSQRSQIRSSRRSWRRTCSHSHRRSSFDVV